MNVKINDLSKYQFINNEIYLDKLSIIFYQINKFNLSKDKYDKKVWVINLTDKKPKRCKILDNYTIVNKLNDEELLLQKKDKFFVYDYKKNKIINFLKLENTEINKIKVLDKDTYLMLIRTNVNDKYEVIRRIPFYSDGSSDFCHNQEIKLVKYNLKDKTIVELSDKNEMVTDFYLNDSNLYYSYQEYNKDQINSRYSGLKWFNLLNNAKKYLIRIEDKKTIYDFYLTDKNRLIVSINDYSRIGMNQNGDWYNLDNKGELTRIESKYDISFWDSVNVDHTYGIKKLSHVDKDVYKISTYKDKQEIFKISNKEISKISNLSGNILSFLKINDEKFLLNYITWNEINELYFYNPKTNELNRLTNHNQEINNSYRKLRPIETFEFENDSYKHIGYVIYPEKFDTNKKYPVVLQIHGGPKTAYSTSFQHEMRMLSSCNAFVIFMNPRGSDGYGEKFSDIRSKYGTVDYEDLIKFTEEFKEKYFKNVDKNNVAVMGGSYGGFMTNWMISHTNKFKAAITQRSIYDWQTMFYNSDIALDFPNDQICKGEYNEELVKKQSPSTFIKNVKTPTLIIHSLNDYRCPIDQAYGLYTNLLANNVDAKLLLFKNNSHGLSRNGTPYCRIGRLYAIQEWLHKHLDNFELDESKELNKHSNKHIN
ncbi:alpha/beta hydrolase family protein [Mycoplasma bradburyae]|uniref:alpha/beta hydrolase family protein n=1 Tax=Mycoplasma bradburyae TaxID=2963128 RepID=UPI002340B2AF|nr:S9 family peptidase [Mycoplasma bradburyae]MDC4183848.1 S9 family peptidase [Mycoplasma bradburyae]